MTEPTCSYCKQYLGDSITDDDCPHCQEEWGRIAKEKYIKENGMRKYKCHGCNREFHAEHATNCTICHSDKIENVISEDKALYNKLDTIISLLKEIKPGDPAILEYDTPATAPVPYTITAILTSTYYKGSNMSKEDMIVGEEEALYKILGPNWDIKDITAKEVEG